MILHSLPPLASTHLPIDGQYHPIPTFSKVSSFAPSIFVFQRRRVASLKGMERIAVLVGTALAHRITTWCRRCCNVAEVVWWHLYLLILSLCLLKVETLSLLSSRQCCMHSCFMLQQFVCNVEKASRTTIIITVTIKYQSAKRSCLHNASVMCTVFHRKVGSKFVIVTGKSW